MAGDLKQFLFEEKENIRRYHSNIDAIIQKYGHYSEDVDILDLSNLKIKKNKGLLRKQRPKYFGHSKLFATKRQEESIHLQQSESLHSYSVNESTDGRSELNSTGGSFVPDITKNNNDESWMNKTYSTRPSRGLETFSLAKQVEDAEDDSEMLSLQKTMLTFIENDDGEPSDAETLSSTSSDSGEKSDILSDKSDSGDETFQDSRSEELLNGRNWESVDEEDVWQDRNDDNFTLVPSPSRTSRTNTDLNCGVRSSDGITWNNSHAKENERFYKWNDQLKRNSNHSASYGTENVIKQQNGKDSRSFVNQTSCVRNRPNSPERINDVIQSSCKLYVNRTTGETKHNKNNAGDTEFSPRHTDVTVPRNNVLHLSDKLHPFDKENILKNGTSDPDITYEPNTHTPSTHHPMHRNSQIKSISNHSKANGVKITPSPYNSGIIMSPRDLVSKSVPCKPAIQNLRDLPEGGLSGSKMYKDPLSSLEKVYRWLSPPPKDTLIPQRHRVNARRRLHLMTSNSDVMRWEDQPGVNTKGKHPEEYYAEDETDGMNHETLMDSPDKTNLIFKQTTGICHADVNLNRVFSPEKNLSLSFGRIRNCGENLNTTPKQLSKKSPLKSPSIGKFTENSCDVNSRNIRLPMDSKVHASGCQFLTPKHSTAVVLNGNMSPQGNFDRTPKQNSSFRNAVGSPSQAHSSSLPIPNSSPWRSQSCGQRFHPYSRKNPDSPSAIFARLKLGLPSPSANKFDPTKRIQFTPESHKADRTTKNCSPRSYRLCDNVDSNHSAKIGRYEDLVLFDKEPDQYRNDQKLSRKRLTHEPMEIVHCKAQESARGEAQGVIEQIHCMDTEMKRYKRFEKYRNDTPGDQKLGYRTKDSQSHRGTNENHHKSSDQFSERRKTNEDHNIAQAHGHSFRYLEYKSRAESKFDRYGEHMLLPGHRDSKKNSESNPNLALPTQNTAGDCKFSNWDRKLDSVSPKMKYDNQQQNSTLTSRSPLVKISSKPKVISPSTSPKSSYTQRTPMVKLQKLNSPSQRTDSFKQPKGYTISLQNKVLVNTEKCRNSTPMKFTVPFALNNTLSTIHGQNSDSESSEEDVLTISPSR